MIKVSKDLETILTPGDKVVGGYYEWEDQWKQTSYEGVMWLTDYTTEFDAQDLAYGESRAEKTMTHVTRLKHVRMGVDQILLVFEVFRDANYWFTGYLIVDDSGRPLPGGVIRQLCGTRLLRGDKIFYDEENKTVHILGQQTEADGSQVITDLTFEF